MIAQPPAAQRDRIERVGSEAELLTLVQSCQSEKRGVHSVGNGTKAHYGSAPDGSALRISLTGLDRITAYEAGDMVVTAGAGTRISALQAALAERDQWLALDPPFDDATVGGMLAAGTAGPRRLGYGTLRDQVLGMRVLGPRGSVTRSGGRVVKNVTGFDLHKLHIGAFGSLGIIVEASFRVRARPAVAAVFALGFNDLHAAVNGLTNVWRSHLTPVALEALDGDEKAALAARVPGLPDAPAVALIGVEGSAPIFDRHRRDLPQLLQNVAGTTGPVAVLRDADSARVWAGMRGAATDRRASVMVRAATRPSDFSQLAAALGIHRGACAQAGTGIVRVRLDARDGATAIAAGVAEWHRSAERLGGYAVVESAPVDMPDRAALPFTPAPLGTTNASQAALDRHLHRSWDPQNVFNPGRMAMGV